MEGIDLGRVIAERQLELVGEDGSVVPCTVRMGAPVSDEHGVWNCPYEVDAGKQVRRFRIFGGDSIQALVLTLKTLDMEIPLIAKKHDAEVLFLGEAHTSVFDP